MTVKEASAETRRLIRSWIVRAFIGILGYALLFFLVAGTIEWLWGWVMLVVLGAFLAAHPLLLVPINPELLAERSKGIYAEGVKVWDQWLVTIASSIYFLAFVLAGLDYRFAWSPPYPLALHLFGLLFSIAAHALFLWAMVSNAFFAEGVRIQEERGHQVCTSGPYRYVRHPGYVGSISMGLSAPLLLGSLWIYIPAVISITLFVLRTYLEDKTLQEELPGYQAYALKVRYRLIPGLW